MNHRTHALTRWKPPQRTSRLLASFALTLLVTGITPAMAADGPSVQRWTDADLTKSFAQLKEAGTLEAAVRSPALPKDAPQPAFLASLAWYAAGMPNEPGELTLAKLDLEIDSNVRSYLDLLEAKAEKGAENDYPRTRTWKVIQKLTLLRAAMSEPAQAGRYSYPALRPSPPPGEDAWEREHTLSSRDQFVDKVCRASYTRPVLVKFGNTNCTQCMLMELTGRVKAFAEQPEQRGVVDVYKVWWGSRPDGSFVGRVKDPARLDDVVHEEGVTSSPTFAVYRNGHRQLCGDAFPDDAGNENRLESCLHQDVAAAPVATVCQSVPAGS